MPKPSEEIPMRVGAAIRRWRKSNGLTMSQLAERADIDAGFLAYIETGKKLPSLTTASKLAAAMGLSLSDLFKDIPLRADDSDFRAEILRLAHTICRRCTKPQSEDLIAVMRLLHHPKKVRAIRTLVDR